MKAGLDMEARRETRSRRNGAGGPARFLRAAALGFATFATLAAFVSCAAEEETEEAPVDPELAPVERPPRGVFDGVRFRSIARRAPGDDRASFVATVGTVSASLKGAREAAYHQGVKYCINRYGTSRIDWTEGPETAEEDLDIENDRLTYRGRCRR